MDIRQAIARVVAREDISFEDMLVVMHSIMAGDASPAQIAGLLVGLHMKGESIDEVSAAATVMRELSVPVKIDVAPLIDTCGTGGDGSKTFNISTATAMVAAAAGGHVAKHGNRSVSSSSGSADVLEAAGARIDLAASDVARSIREVGVGFMFAPAHHGATRHAAGPRRELGIRTLFNVLGPLTNPARAPRQLVGVFNAHWQDIVAQVLARLGCERAFVVNAADGLDEISICATTRVLELRNGRISRFEIDPREHGFALQSPSELLANDASHSLAIINAVFDNKPGAARDIVILNAGAAIYLCDLVSELDEGFAMAGRLIADGAVARQFARFVAFSQAVVAEAG